MTNKRIDAGPIFIRMKVCIPFFCWGGSTDHKVKFFIINIGYVCGMKTVLESSL